MTFFYNLNQKLDSIRATPEVKHGQLNERANSNPVEEGLGDMARKVGGAVKRVAGKALDTMGHGSDADLIRDMQKRAGMPQTGMKPGSEPNPKVVKEKMSPDKAKSFAALAPPTDKITFADKIAGAKKEVDEMLGDVAADAMKKALGGGRGRDQEMDEAGYSAKAARAGKDIGKPGKQFAKIAKGAAERYGSKERGEKVAGAVLNKLRKGGVEEASDDNAFTAHKRPRVDAPKVGTVTHGRKHDVEEIPGGRRVTRRVDPSGISVGADDEAAQSGEKRGRGRPKKAGGPAQERVTAKSRKTDRTTFQSKKTNEGDDESPDLKAAMAMLKKAGYEVTKGGEEELEEKAVSKKQQKFMGMVHATQKGEKAPSKEVAKVAKEMPKKAATDFASTKHKGLPEKAKSDDAPKKKKEKTEEAGGSGTPTASSGFSYGKGIYDSLNRDLEDMIAENMQDLRESMSMNMSMNDDAHGGPGKSLTVTATDEDAVYLGKLLKMAGLGQGDSGSSCGCGQADCSCGQEEEMEEAYGDTNVTPNSPDYPTNTETNSDPFQYSGGLNKPKSTGQTTVPVIASQDERQESYASEEEDAIKRMMEMAGLSETKGKKPDFLDVDKDGDKKEPFKKAVKDKEEVDESIFAMTAKLWKTYKG